MSESGRVWKTNHYVAQACDRCEAAKVRCDGEFRRSYCAARNLQDYHYRTACSPVRTG